jgi:hypothetical protein
MERGRRRAQERDGGCFEQELVGNIDGERGK